MTTNRWRRFGCSESPQSSARGRWACEWPEPLRRMQARRNTRQPSQRRRRTHGWSCRSFVGSRSTPATLVPPQNPCDSSHETPLPPGPIAVLTPAEQIGNSDYGVVAPAPPISAVRSADSSRNCEVCMQRRDFVTSVLVGGLVTPVMGDGHAAANEQGDRALSRQRGGGSEARLCVVVNRRPIGRGGCGSSPHCPRSA